MRAVCWQGKEKIGVEVVPDPRILNPHDAIIEVTATAICGSDLHLYANKIPTMMKGDILGHEFMGRIVEVGAAVENLRAGDKVVVPFNIACGRCTPCRRGLFSLCDNTNPNAWLADKVCGHAGSALFGYTHAYGGYAGGQAEYVRVPFADVGCLPVPEGVDDEQVLFLSDVFPTGYMAAENCSIKPGQTIAVWGLGPVGQFAVRSALMLGAERVVAIDRIPARLAMAERVPGVVVLNYEETSVLDELDAMTAGKGPDGCIDAVGMEAHGHSIGALYDQVRNSLKVQTDRLTVLRQAIQACRKGGVVSIPGVYGGLLDKLNFGAAFAKGLDMRMGQTHTHRYMRPLLERILAGDIDPSFVISHRLTLDDAPEAYRIFQAKEEDCTKVVMRPQATLH